MSNLSSENLKAIYSNIIKSIETMKGDMEKIGGNLLKVWKTMMKKSKTL